MEQNNNQSLLLNDHGIRNSRSTTNYSILSNRLPNKQSCVSPNRLPNADSKYFDNRLPSNDSGISFKCKHYSGSSTEATANPSDDKQKTHSRNDETRRKSVSFSLGSSNLTDEYLCVADINIDSDLETDSDLTFVNNSQSLENSYTSRLSRGRTRRNSIRDNNTTLKRHRSAYSESDGNSTMRCKYDCSASQVNVMGTIPTRSTSYNADFRTDQRSVLQHQHLPGSPCSTTNQGQNKFLQYLPCHSHPNFEAVRFRSYPSIHHEADRNLDSQSSAPLLDDTCHNESDGSCATSQESHTLPRETQTSATIAGSVVSNTPNNKTVDDESAVSVPRSCYTNKTMKTCIIIVLVFNIIFLAVTGFIISMLLYHHTYDECPLCKDIMDQMKTLKGANINDTTIQEYLKENDEDGHCCLDHVFIFKLMAQISPSNQALQQYPTEIYDNIINRIINSSEKVALHLQSMKGTIPFSPQLSDGDLPGQKIDMEMIRWKFDDKTNVKLGSSWETLDSGTKIKIPLTGVYYIYAMVQYRYQTVISTQPSDSLQNVEEFPLSTSLYKIPLSENTYSRIGTVTQHCKFASQSIEHNSIMQRLVRLTKDDKVFLAVSNKQFLQDEPNMQQIGIFKVD